MSDVLRIVEIPALGDAGRFRPAVLFDLEDAVNVKERDTFTVTPPSREPTVTQRAGRRGGQLQVGERQGNARVAATWRVKGASTDAVLGAVEAMLQQADALLERPARYIEWRPEGAARSTFFEPRGAGEATPTYRWSDVFQARSMQVELGWPVAPLALGEPMDVDDAFAVDSEADYRLDAGLAANVAVAGGALTFTGALGTYYRLVHVAKGYRTNDKTLAAEFRVGAVGTGANPVKVAVMLKVVDAANYLYAEYTDNGTTREVALRAVVGGAAPTTVATAASQVLTVATDYELIGGIEGDFAWVGLDTTGGATLERTQSAFPGGGTASATLAGATEAALGDPAVGEGGIMVQPQNAGTKVNRLLVEHFSYRNATVGTRTLRGVPGTAPALVAAEVSPNDSLGAWHAALGWNRPLASSPALFGVVDAPSGTVDGTGWTAGAADSAALGGAVHRLNLATAAAARWYALLADDSLDADPFSDSCLVEVWAVMRVPTTAVALTLAARTNPLGPTGPRGDDAYTLDWGAYGRRVATPAAAGLMPYRVGAIPVPVIPHQPGGQGTYLFLEFGVGSGSTGNLDLDHLLLLPASRRAMGPTGKLTNSDYPKLLDGSDRKRVRPDLSTLRMDDRYFATGLKVWPSAGFEGAALEPDPVPGAGALAVCFRAGRNVPDDPQAALPEGQDAPATDAQSWQFRVTPRWRLARS